MEKERIKDRKILCWDSIIEKINLLVLNMEKIKVNQIDQINKNKAKLKRIIFIIRIKIISKLLISNNLEQKKLLLQLEIYKQKI